MRDFVAKTCLTIPGFSLQERITLFMSGIFQGDLKI